MLKRKLNSRDEKWKCGRVCMFFVEMRFFKGGDLGFSLIQLTWPTPWTKRPLNLLCKNAHEFFTVLNSYTRRNLFLAYLILLSNGKLSFHGIKSSSLQNRGLLQFSSTHSNLNNFRPSIWPSFLSSHISLSPESHSSTTFVHFPCHFSLFNHSAIS